MGCYLSVVGVETAGTVVGEGRVEGQEGWGIAEVGGCGSGGGGGGAERVDSERPARHVRLDTCNKIYKSVSPASL